MDVRAEIGRHIGGKGRPLMEDDGVQFPETLYRHHGQDQEESDDDDVQQIKTKVGQFR